MQSVRDLVQGPENGRRQTITAAARPATGRRPWRRSATTILDDPFFLGGSDLANPEVMRGARR
jgi:hypothetical protein